MIGPAGQQEAGEPNGKDQAVSCKKEMPGGCVTGEAQCEGFGRKAEPIYEVGGKCWDG